MLRDGHGARAIHSRTFHPIARHVPILGAGTVDAVDKSIWFEVWVPMLSHPVSLVLEHAERVRRFSSLRPARVHFNEQEGAVEDYPELCPARHSPQCPHPSSCSDGRELFGRWWRWWGVEYKLLVLPPVIKREFVRQAGSLGEPVL